ncbi:MAG: hypothetical protein JWN84_890 [Nocardioides sp.]|nr:hypothetical protein [Nocardioides sp.]
MHTATRAAGVLAGLTLTFGSLGAVAPAVAADAPEKAPCAQQQTQVDRAEDALTRLTAVFERKQAKVEKAKDRAAAADTAQERNAARKALRTAKAEKAEAKEAKGAQQQRLAKAQERLEECQAAQA